MLRKCIVAWVGATLLVGSALGPAAATKPKKTTRVVEDDYATPAVVVPPGNGTVYACSTREMNGTDNLGCADVPVALTERFATIEVTDSTGLPAAAYVYPHYGAEEVLVCGKTAEPIHVSPGVLMEIWFQAIAPGCPGIATSGTFRVTLSNRR